MRWSSGFGQVSSETFLTGDSVADPGSGAFFTPGSGMGKKSRSGSGIPRALKQFFGFKKLKFFYADLDPGSGIFLTLDRDGKIRILDLGSGIHIPDPQH
jgi:hypothetical protein